jgi:membrane associated rhomboid family serine protease
MMVAVFSVVITLATSAAPYVDWGAHVGGAIMGWLLGIALLSSELDNKRHAVCNIYTS